MKLIIFACKEAQLFYVEKSKEKLFCKSLGICEKENCKFYKYVEL